MLASESQQVTASPNANTIFMVWKFKDGVSQDALIEGFQNLCGLVINLNHTAANRYSPENASIVLGISHSAWLTPGFAQATALRRLVEFERLGAISTPRCPLPAICTSTSVRPSRPSPTIWRPLLPRLCAILLRLWMRCTASATGTAAPSSVLWTAPRTRRPPRHANTSAIIGDSDPMYRGGSYQFVQKYIHA